MITALITVLIVLLILGGLAAAAVVLAMCFMAHLAAEVHFHHEGERR
jgi:hypothetical protein